MQVTDGVRRFVAEPSRTNRVRRRGPCRCPRPRAGRRTPRRRSRGRAAPLSWARARYRYRRPLSGGHRAPSGPRRRPARRAARPAARPGRARSTGSTRSGSYGSSSSSANRLTPDDRALAAVDLLRDRVRRALDLALLEAPLDRGDRAAESPRPAASGVARPPRGRRSSTRRRTSRRTGRPWRSRRSRRRAPAGCAARAGPTSRSAARSPRRRSSCAATACRRGRRPSACTATRTRLTSGCCAVSCTPAVWVWKRSISDFGFCAPNSSRMTSAQIRRAARNFATSSSSVVRETKKNASRGRTRRRPARWRRRRARTRCRRRG